MHRGMESPNTSQQVIDLNPNCSKQAHLNRVGTGHEYENTEHGCFLTVLRVPSVIRPLGVTRLTRSIQLSKSPEIVKLFIMFWPCIPSAV